MGVPDTQTVLGVGGIQRRKPRETCLDLALSISGIEPRLPADLYAQSTASMFTTERNDEAIDCKGRDSEKLRRMRLTELRSLVRRRNSS